MKIDWASFKVFKSLELVDVNFSQFFFFYTE